MITYDPKVIQECAEQLYTKAESIVRNYSILGFVIVGIVSIVQQHNLIPSLIGAIAGGFIGFNFGTEKAFQYKLQAQTALCQVEIESNSKK